MLNKKKYIFIVSVLSLILSFSCVRALGVTQPIPEYQTVARGESIEFYFQIQGDVSSYSCSYSASDLEPLSISFEEEKVVVEPNENKKIYGTIFVPEDSPISTYNGKLHVSCEPLEAGPGSTIKPSPIVNFHSISVVEQVGERVRQPIREEEKPTPPKPSVPVAEILTIIIIVILVISIYYWSKRKKE